ncbi:MAG TPA: glutamate mutase L, partial [Herpetosiphonaceae bacterium]
MEYETATPEHGALLVVEIGLDQTRVTLVDVVDQSYRMVARAVSPSTFGPPDNDPTRAIIAALRQIEQTTSRELLQGDDLRYPQDDAGNGVDGVVATTSAAGPLSVAVAGIADHASVRSVTHAIRSTYTTLLETIALDEGGKELGKHLMSLVQTQPDVVVIAGGDAGDKAKAAPHKRLAHLVSLLATHGDNQPLVIFAGNSAAADEVRQTIGEAAPVEVSDNVVPLPQHPRIEPTRSLLRRIYQERRVAALPGAERLRMVRCRRLGSAVEDQGLMVRFLSQRFSRNVLAVSVDSWSTACLLMSGGHYSEAIFGRLGTRLGVLDVLKARGPAAIQRWLPFELDEQTLHNRLLNRVLRPYQVATDLDDLLLDYAIMREALSTAYLALRDERPDAQYDLVFGGGALADAPRPGLAALALLDALQPTSRDSVLAIDLYLDQFSLLAASGALAHLDTDAAACLLEQDGLNNVPLATVIVPRGELAPGKKIADVELRPVHGTPITRTVSAGQIVRLPLARGKRATLRIQPVSGIAIGPNKPGTEVLSDEAA